MTVKEPMQKIVKNHKDVQKSQNRLEPFDSFVYVYPSPLIEGVFVKRYKRFFADIEIDGKVEVAVVPNTGSLKTCLEPGAPCRVSRSNDPKRKFSLTLEQMRAAHSWVGVNTHLPNRMVACLLENESFAEWMSFRSFYPEVKISAQSRIDFVLTKQPSEKKRITINDLEVNPHNFRLIEVKNVTMGEKGCAYFPDSVTERGQKHLKELMQWKALGAECEMIYLIQRDDCSNFEPASLIDPVYTELFHQAKKVGVKITPLFAKIDSVGISLKTNGESAS
ncbi:MAG: DNA/RNA nuclease SfsA [Bdellovibrionales bacterium CG10_big_fil_rev_8_21_14_0_10_45_34]|nr:MAG: DNA/RNA nuclease SfsA [Bdellovibrionales bacterium CG10_big_fil_rev_8_21_14_0_10_45_34]